MAGSDNSAGDSRGQAWPQDRGNRDGDGLAAKLSELARALEDEDDVEATLQAIVDAAIDTVPGARYAGLSVVEGRRKVTTQAGTDELVFAVDRVQYETGQGPCLDAVYEQQTVRLEDMSTEDRWPDFTRRSMELGVQSMLSFQLFVRKDNLGR
jgi:putative methionine-R-sulfoxide reductase with GAF domain